MLRNYRILAVLLTALPLVAAAAAQERQERQSRRSPIVEVFEQCRDAVVNISTTRIVRVRSLRYGSATVSVISPVLDVKIYLPVVTRNRDSLARSIHQTRYYVHHKGGF